MSNIITLALLAGLVLGLARSFKKFHFKRISKVVILLSFIFVLVSAVSIIFFDYQLLNLSQPLDQSFIFLAWLSGVASLTVFNLKEMDLYISELQYVVYSVMIGFVLFSIFNPSITVAFACLAGSLLLLSPIFFSNVLSTQAKFTYYILFSGTNIVLFSILIGFTGLIEILSSFPVTLGGLLASFLFGWSMYLYFVHAVILTFLLPTKHGWHLKDLYRDIPGHFGDVQYRPVVLIFASVVCLIFLFSMEYLTQSLVLSISFTMTVIAFLSKFDGPNLHK